MRYTFSLPDGSTATSAMPVLGIAGAILVSQQPDAGDVRAEASRRLKALVGARDAAHLETLISNGVREAVRLLRLRDERAWTPEETARAEQLRQVDAAIEEIRAASNLLEPDPPADYLNGRNWP